MHRIVIKNFGPLIDVDMVPEKFTFLIGEQASGKSTLAKLIYFFRTFQEEFLNTLYRNDDDDWKAFRKSFVSFLRDRFTGIFGETRMLGDFSVTYFFTELNYVNIFPEQKKVFTNIDIEKSLINELRAVWTFTKTKSPIINSGLSPIFNILLNEESKEKLIKDLNSIFDDDAYINYIPAGRAFISQSPYFRTMQVEESKRVNPNAKNEFDSIIDTPTINYILEVDRVRQYYLSPSHKNKLLGESSKNEINYIRNLSKSILKAIYTPDKWNDYLTIEGGKRIRINHASSGQQEALWLLNLINFYAVEKRKCCLIIEELEAHLHPEAQYMLAKAFAAFCNYTGSQIFITTHSPYILSSFNNLIYAHLCGENTDEVENLKEMISDNSWVSPNEFLAYIIEQGKLKTIKDDVLATIDLAELDAISSKQDTEFEIMLSLQAEGK